MDAEISQLVAEQAHIREEIGRMEALRRQCSRRMEAAQLPKKLSHLACKELDNLRPQHKRMRWNMLED